MAVGNSGDVIISQTSFYGGMGTDKKIGIKNSFADAECMDARKNPSVMTVLPGSDKMSDADLAGLINSMTQTPDGNRWGIATNGGLYKIDAANDITKVADLPNWTAGSFGDLAYWPLTDSIYITGADRIYQYTPVIKSGTPAVTTITGTYSTYPTMAQILVRDRDGKWIGGGTSRWTYKGSATTYAVPTTLQETDDHKCIFLPDQSPMTAIDVKFIAKPASGNVTLTVHDQQNKIIATATVAAADVSTSGNTRFTFPQTELGEYKNFGTEYHIHLVASASGFTVASYEANKLYGLWFYFYAALLLNTKKKNHPILNWAGSKLLIGNGQYLVDWLPSGLQSVDASEFSRHRVIIETGMEISSLTSNDEYVVLGCEKVGQANTRVFQSGMLGFWDGFADAINFKIDTPMGEPKSLYTYLNITYCVIDGALYAYTGGKALTKVRTIQDSQSEYTGIEDKTDVYSHSMTVRRGILLMAYPSITNLLTMRHGVYSWGAVDKNYPNSFYYSYDIPEAAGNYNTAENTYEIGGIWNFGDTLYFSYCINGEAVVSMGKLNWSLGNVSNSTGENAPMNGRIRSNTYISVRPGVYTVQGLSSFLAVARRYDSSNAFIGTSSVGGDGKLTIPEGTAKIRLLIVENPDTATMQWPGFEALFDNGTLAPTIQGVLDTFNIAIVNNSSKPAKKFKYESLAYDGGMPWKEKMANRIAISTDPLPTGSKIKLKYKIDNQPWKIDNRELIEAGTEVFMEINKRFHEIQFGFQGTNDGSTFTPPRITSVALNARELSEEGKLHK